jgi:glycosyltransferase involved in cell wall biosynthesis
MSKLKIAVYTIALNEEKHVRRWVASAREADLIVIADTGSIDNTRMLAKSLGVKVTQIEVNPWRFDVARNASLAMVPEDFDVCISLDMDEVLPINWRTVIEEAYLTKNFWPVYKTVNSRYPSGAPRYFWHGFKIHPRKGFHWKYPIHEVLVPEPNLNINRKEIDLEIDHLKDPSKSRGSYLGLLELAVQEDPSDWRMCHYLNREYYYLQDWLKVLQTAYQCRQLVGGWDVERSSTYIWASEAANVLKFSELAEEWAERATLAAPNFYEAWHWRAHIAHLNKKWADCLDFAKKRLTLERHYHHLVKPDIWEWWGYDLIALSNYKLGNMKEASFYGQLALEGNPNNERLKKNLIYYQAGE